MQGALSSEFTHNEPAVNVYTEGGDFLAAQRPASADGAHAAHRRVRVQGRHRVLVGAPRLCLDQPRAGHRAQATSRPSHPPSC